MPIKNPKHIFVLMLSDLRQGGEKTTSIFHNRRYCVQSCAQSAARGLGQADSSKPRHSRKSHRWGGGMGRVVSRLCGRHPGVPGQEQARPPYLLPNWSSQSVRTRRRCRKSSPQCHAVGSRWKSGRIRPGSVACSARWGMK